MERKGIRKAALLLAALLLLLAAGGCRTEVKGPSEEQVITDARKRLVDAAEKLNKIQEKINGPDPAEALKILEDGQGD